MTCEDCLHYDICVFHIKGNENENCIHYKNKENFTEVKHGCWILEAEYKDGTTDYKCSVCDYDDTFLKKLIYFYRYCPYCGAEMKGRCECTKLPM